VTPRQRLVTRTLQLFGVAAIAIPLALLVFGLAGVLGVSAGFGLYRVLMLAFGCAVLSRARELQSPEGWTPLESWWAGSVPDRRAMLGRTAGIVVQLALLLVLIRAFEIENPAFWKFIAPLALGGCVIHHLTPSRHRLSIFLLLSLAAIWLVFGAPDAFWLVGVGIALVAMCHLPMPYWPRVAGVVVLGAALAAARAQLLPVPWSHAIWPILGSIFMFRMIVYLYDLRHEKVPATWPQRLAYFFLLPNVVFPLFPVVDYGAFRRTYYDADAYRIYQRGIEWIFRGILQLILYRVIYQYWVIPQSDVRTGIDVTRFMVTSFLLYVRVSGQFHLIVGILHLFGFHLPETHRRYFLASSFTDFWRRINIYWKDFMTKVFYYPVHFRLRRLGERPAMILATLVVFGMTWVLHSYQWFWLLGSFPVTITDTLFWGVLAGLLVVNSLHEARHGRARTLGTRTWTPRMMAMHSLKVAGTFAAISLLWSLWMSPTFADWMALWSVDRFAAARASDAYPLLLGFALTTGVSSPPGRRWLGFVTREGREWSFARRVTATVASIGGILLIAHPAISARLGSRVGGTIASVRTSQLNKADENQLQRGYYEDLMGVSRFNSQLWEAYMQKPPAEAWPKLEETKAVRPTNDYLKTEFVPNARIDFLGESLTVNRWGMRDRDYERAKPPGVRRMALVGVSVDMGWGVKDEESYENLAERRLNEAPPPGTRNRFEILNFSIAAHTVVHHLLILERVLSFEPDVVLVPAHGVDARMLIDHIMERSAAGVPIPIDTLRSAAEAAGVGRLPDAEARQRLSAHQDELVQWLYIEMVRRIRERGALPVWFFVPVPANYVSPEDIAVLSKRAAEAGFEVIDIADAYAGHDVMALRLREFDRHPNLKGNQLLADRLYRALIDNPKILGVQREKAR
jgi:D-alanyl-lipoteichoic acid acyltransferase DltB (MBOAT superfamily)